MKTHFQPGDVLLGKYRVEASLGQGGMGIVLAVRHINLGELFAVKLLKSSIKDGPNVAERFVREAQALARLKGEHVVKVHDVGRVESGELYMIMEHLVGTDLKGLIEARGALPVDEVIEFMVQACAGVAEAHAAGIIHRDIKPSNLFLTLRPSGTPCIKVLDFGISKRLGLSARDLTRTGSTLGSPSYMSPEQIKNTKQADVRSDIWSLGVVLYELITGKKPFTPDRNGGVIKRVLEASPKPPRTIVRGLSPTVDAIVMRCLQEAPANRFQSVAELAVALNDSLRSSLTIEAENNNTDPTETYDLEPDVTDVTDSTPAPEEPSCNESTTRDDTTRRASPEASALPIEPPLDLLPPISLLSPRPEVRALPPPLVNVANSPDAWLSADFDPPPRFRRRSPLKVGVMVTTIIAVTGSSLYALWLAESGSASRDGETNPNVSAEHPPKGGTRR